MARMRSDVPRMQKPSPARAPRPTPAAAALPAGEKSAPARKPPMMRQYDLIERVRRYNPDTNEALLNRAYVYAMKAHGGQTRASGDPYFSHPLEVAGILTEFRLDDASIVAALVIAVLSVAASIKSTTVVLFVLPLCALAIPLIDMGLAIARRWLSSAKASCSSLKIPDSRAWFSATRPVLR